MHLFDLTTTDKKGKCKMIFSQESNIKQIFGISWNPANQREFVSAGEHHLFFWDLNTIETNESVSKNSAQLTTLQNATAHLGFVAVAFN